MDTATTHLWDKMIDCQLGLLAALDQELAAKGLNALNFDVLRILAAAPQRALRLAELAQGVRHSQSGTTRLVDRLEKDGLVRRRNCASDRRVTYAELTDTGWELFEGARPVWESFLKRRLNVLTEVEATQYWELLIKIQAAGQSVHLDGACPTVAARADGLQNLTAKA